MSDKKPEKKADKKFDKKGDKKPAPEAATFPYLIVFALLAMIFFLPQLFSRFLELFGFTSTDGNVSEGSSSFFDSATFDSYKRLFVGLVSSAQVIAAFISLLLIMGIIYARFKLNQIKREEKLQKLIKQKQTQKQEAKSVTENKKWNRVLEHVSSTNPSDWRLSVLEADILLADLLDKVNLTGETIGDKLKSATTENFHSLQIAWEAHKIRNLIAHEGSDFNLSQREAKRVIALYEEVFKEFYFI